MTTIDWATLPASEVYPGISRQMLDGERQTMIRYVYQPGAVFPEHDHQEEQISLVISGQIEFTVAGDTHLLSAGNAAIIPSGVPHGARVISDQVVETFNAISPRRDRHPGPAVD